MVRRWLPHAALVAGGTCAVVVGYLVFSTPLSITYAEPIVSAPAVLPPPPVDKPAYDMRLLALGHVATSSPWYEAFLEGTTASTTLPRPLWPVRAAYPRDGRALLPFNRIVAYYGNFYSTQMGILGEYPEAEVLARLASTTAEWEAADPSTPVIPAIEYIDVTAQAAAGRDGKYRARMSDTQIDKALEMAHKINGIVVLDLQVGLSSVQEEIPEIEKYLAMPDVHLALDPEFAMHNGARPGTVIGSMDAADFNWAAQYLADLVRTYNLPPKILLIHRFTEGMVTNYQNIEPLPEVQVVVQMDGWGSPQRKQNTYRTVITPEPVQFAGLKLFYKNDLKENPPRLLTMDEIFNLIPIPIYIQYQ